MAVPFPPDAVYSLPSGFSSFNYAVQAARNGVFYQDSAAPSFTLSQSGATTYQVRDYDGDVISSGSVSGTTVTPAVPSGGWICGWYRLYLFGSSDTNFGTSKGSINFMVIPAATTLFPALPGNTVPSNGDGNHDDYPELVSKPMLGVGTSRLKISDASAPHVGNPSTWDTLDLAASDMEIVSARWLGGDPVRPRYQWIAFPDGGYDHIGLEDTGNPGHSFLQVYCKDETVDGSKVFVALTSEANPTLRVYYPNASTLVETYSSLPSRGDAETAINGVSDYIQVFPAEVDSISVAISATAIGKSKHDGVVLCVSTLFPLGATHFEGPTNEPSMTTYDRGRENAHKTMLFQAAVHSGHPDAKAMGPCTVNITDLATGWAGFLDYCDDIGFDPDVISFHDYNTVVNGDLNEGRAEIEAFLALLADHGMDGKELWQTEANHNLSSVYGVYHPRRARVTMMKTELWEQYGIASERNPYWYDYSHGFWSFPAWAWNSNRGPNPPIALLAARAREIHGKAWHHHVDFGHVIANRMFVGNVYGDATNGSVMVLLCCSYMEDSTVTVTIDGTTDPIVVADSFGNTASVSQSSGRITVDVLDTPTYLRLPAGVNAYVYSIRDWQHSAPPSVSSTKTSASIGGAVRPGLADDRFMTVYTGSSTSPGITFSDAELPDTADVTFDDTKQVERIVVFCGPYHQSMPGLVDFDLTADGNVEETITYDTPSSFSFVSSSNDIGCHRETYDKERWIFDVKFPSPVTATTVGIDVRETSYGGEPDLAAATANNNGMVTRKLAIQEIAVISPTAFVAPPDYATLEASLNPIGAWAMGEPDGATIAASSANSPALDGTYVGSPDLGVPGAVGGTTAVDLSYPSYVSVADNALLHLGDHVTIVAWYKLISPPSAVWRPIASKGGFSYGMVVNPEDKLVLERARNSETVIVKGTTALQSGVWTFVAATKDGATAKVYVNGADDSDAATLISHTLSNGGDPLTIGPAGIVEFLAVFAPLTDANILALYKSGIAPKPPVNDSEPLVYA